MTNIQKAVALLKSIETGVIEPMAYINARDYTEHDLSSADGFAGFKELLSLLPKDTTKVNPIRAFEDGDYVFTHTDFNFFGPKIGFDIFRFKQGLIVEHWDNLMPVPPSLNPSGRSCLDGETEIKDIDKTELNKSLVTQFINDLILKIDTSQLAHYFDGDNYIQHNPTFADGVSGLSSGLTELAKQGIDMSYTRIHKVLGHGNFVLVVSEGNYGGDHTAYFDLFRVDKSKIVEHWDVITVIPDKSTWRNNNGKFGFEIV